MTPEVSADISAPDITSQDRPDAREKQGCADLGHLYHGVNPSHHGHTQLPAPLPSTETAPLPRCPLCRLSRTGLPSWTPSQSDPHEEGDPQSGRPSVLGAADTLLHTGSSHWPHPLTPLWTLRTSRHLSSWKIQTWSHWTPSQSCETLVRKTNE